MTVFHLRASTFPSIGTSLLVRRADVHTESPAFETGAGGETVDLFGASGDNTANVEVSLFLDTDIVLVVDGCDLNPFFFDEMDPQSTTQ